MFNQSKYLSTPTLPHTMTIKHSNMMDDILTEFITYHLDNKTSDT